MLDHLHAYHVMQDIIREKEHLNAKYVVVVDTVILLHQVSV